MASMLRYFSKSFLSSSNRQRLLAKAEFPDKFPDKKSLIIFHHRYFCADYDGKKKAIEKFVLLHDENGKVIGNRSLEEAQQIADKRKMRLEKIDNANNKKEWFKLIFKKDFVTKETSVKKEVKSINLSVGIADHDIRTKGKQVGKWISKNVEVRVGITGPVQVKSEQLETTMATFQKHLEAIPHNAIKLKSRQGVLQYLLRSTKGEKL